MYRQLIHAVRLLFLLSIMALISMQSPPPTRAMTSGVAQDGQQLSKFSTNMLQQATTLTTSPCDEIHTLIRTPTEQEVVVADFQSFFDYTASIGYNPMVKAGPITSNDLAGQDVVILTLTYEPPAITAEEINLIQTWVNAGGGLLVLYKGGTGIQALANAFGVSFVEGWPGVITDPTDSQGYPYDFTVFYQKDNFLDHSIMQDVDEFYTWMGYAVLGAGEPLITADADASPSGAAVARIMQLGNGRALFLGDEQAIVFGLGNQRFVRQSLYWLARGTNPPSYTDDADYDGDGLSNAKEAVDGWENAAGYFYTNPCDFDTDDDGLTDDQERLYQTNPRKLLPFYFHDKDINHDFYSWNPFTTDKTLGFKNGDIVGAGQEWDVDTTFISASTLGFGIRGTLWGPELCCEFNWSTEQQEAKDWGGIEIQITSTDIPFRKNNAESTYTFHTLVQPVGIDNLPDLEMNVEADVYLTTTWDLITLRDTVTSGDLGIKDSIPNLNSFEESTQGTLAGEVEAPLPGNYGSLGVSADGEGNFSVRAFYAVLSWVKGKKTASLGTNAPFVHTPPYKGTQLLSYNGLADFNTYSIFAGKDKHTRLILDTPLKIEVRSNPVPCTELLRMNIKGTVDWRVGNPFRNPNHKLMSRAVDDTFYFVLQSFDYADVNDPNYGRCLNQVNNLINSPNLRTQLVGQTSIQKSLSNIGYTAGASQALASIDNGSDESFKFVTLTPFDSNGDTQPDASTITWDADTTAPQADVFVVVQVDNGVELARYLYGPYTITGTSDDVRQLNFYSTVNGPHHFTVGLLEVAGKAEDGYTNEQTLTAGPGDTGTATLTAITTTITGQTAVIDWRATTNLPQENLSLALAVTGADGAIQILQSGPYTATSGSEINGQFVFNAPANGHYEGKLLLRDLNAKVEQESFIALPVGVAATTFTGNIADTPLDTNSNGQPDALQVTAEINFGEDGNYVLKGVLRDNTGQLIARTQTFVTRTVGIGSVALVFDGLPIYHHGQNGPYAVELSLVGPTAIMVAARPIAHTTAAYALGAFGVPPATLGGSHTQSVFDENSDGLYEELQVRVQVNVSTPSTYTVSAILRSPNGDYVTSVMASRPLAAGSQTIPLNFNGTELREKAINGPYTVADVVLKDFAGRTIDKADSLYVTNGYAHTQFAPLGAKLSNTYNSFAWDTDNDGLFNYLALDVGVAVTLTGKYRVSGSLIDPNGTIVPFSSSALYYLEAGNRTIRIPFDGINIQSIGSTSQFTLREIQLLDRDDEILDEQLGDLYTTAAYQHNQFEPGLRTAPLSMLNDDMEDGKSNWVADAPWRHVYLSGPNTAWSDHPTLPYANNTNGSLTSVPVSLEDLTNAALSFRTKYALEANADFGYVEISHDNGQNWLTLAALTASSDWHYQNISIAQYSGQPRVQVRFRLATNGSVTAQGWFVDNVKIVEASALPGPTATPTAPATNTPTVTPTATNTPLPTDTPTPTNTPLATNTPATTNTPLPTDTPTPGAPPTPTATPAGGNATMIYISTYSNGTIGGVAFYDEDIIAYNMTTGVWSLIFDGSDVSAIASVDALHVESDGSLLLSFSVDTTVAGFGPVAEEDIVRFTPTSLGATTAGSFTWFFDGSDVELDTDAEDIDTLTRLPDGRLVIGAAGLFTAGGVSGVEHDLFLFTPTSLGETTSGSWQLYFDGSDVGLSGTNEDLWGVELAPNGGLYLSAQYAYGVPGFSGDGDDILLCTPGAFGDNTSCTYSLYWNGDPYGVDGHWIDALAIVAPGGTVPTPTATATTNPPTATPTPGDPPTPTATPAGGNATMIYISTYANGTIGGVAFNDEDIIAYNMTTGVWSLIFDGSDVSAIASVDALHVESDGSLLLSFSVDTTIAGFGPVAEEDIVRFTPTSLGATTAGSFTWFFDGSDVELDTDAEDIDTLTRLLDGRLVIGSAGLFSAGGVSGVEHDLFLFTPTSLGETTSGSWQLYFDGSDVGLSGTNEDLWGVELAPNGGLYLNAQYAYGVPGFSGDGDDILLCTPGAFGDNTSCTYSLYWNGDTYGVSGHWLDALAISDVALVASANAERTSAETEAPRSQVYLPLINR